MGLPRRPAGGPGGGPPRRGGGPHEGPGGVVDEDHLDPGGEGGEARRGGVLPPDAPLDDPGHLPPGELRGEPLLHPRPPSRRHHHHLLEESGEPGEPLQGVEEEGAPRQRDEGLGLRRPEAAALPRGDDDGGDGGDDGHPDRLPGAAPHTAKGSASATRSGTKPASRIIAWSASGALPGVVR